MGKDLILCSVKCVKNRIGYFQAQKEAYRFWLIEYFVCIEDIAIKLIRGNANMLYKLRDFVVKVGGEVIRKWNDTQNILKCTIKFIQSY